MSYFHKKYFKIADIVIKVESPIPFSDNSFSPKFKPFEVTEAQKIDVDIQHYFSFPRYKKEQLGQLVYNRLPWEIYKRNNHWVYLNIARNKDVELTQKLAVFNYTHTQGKIYNLNDTIFKKGMLQSLTLFSSDQIVLARVLADYKGCYLHSCGVNFEGKGLLFVGHSGAGKSTIAEILKDKAEILCDDRIIVRKRHDTFRIYGTWSHGTVSNISSGDAPLSAIFFLKKSKINKIIPVKDKKVIIAGILGCVIRPLITKDWWEKNICLVEDIVNELPCFELYFDKSGKILKLLEKEILNGAERN